MLCALHDQFLYLFFLYFCEQWARYLPFIDYCLLLHTLIYVLLNLEYYLSYDPILCSSLFGAPYLKDICRACLLVLLKAVSCEAIWDF